MADNKFFTQDQVGEALTQALIAHLAAAYETFGRRHEIPAQVALAAAMRFHALIILNIEGQNRLPPAQQVTLRDLSVENFRLILENHPSLSGEPGEGKEAQDG